MNSSNNCVVLEDRELEMIAGGAPVTLAHQSGLRSSDAPPSVGLPRPEMGESAAPTSGNATIGLA